MADAFQLLVKSCRAAKGVAGSEFGSQTENSRLAIRRSICERLSPTANLDDLSILPELPEWSISVSHTTDYGGWIAVPRGSVIGLDFEMRARLNKELLQRIATPEELNQAPDPRFVWAAKEAAFKALRGPQQPKAFSEVQITNWRPQFSLWTFSSQLGTGWVTSDPSRIYGVFLI